MRRGWGLGGALWEELGRVKGGGGGIEVGVGAGRGLGLRKSSWMAMWRWDYLYVWRDRSGSLEFCMSYCFNHQWPCNQFTGKYQAHKTLLIFLERQTSTPQA